MELVILRPQDPFALTVARGGDSEPPTITRHEANRNEIDTIDFCAVHTELIGAACITDPLSTASNTRGIETDYSTRQLPRFNLDARYAVPVVICEVIAESTAERREDVMPNPEQRRKHGGFCNATDTG